MKIRLIVPMAGLLACTLAAAADTTTPATRLRDPWIPPELRKAAPQLPTHGAALKAQVEARLRATFDAADRTGRGSVTLEEARSAGLGAVANNFARIDANRTGRVTFEDFKRYLRERGADL